MFRPPSLTIHIPTIEDPQTFDGASFNQEIRKAYEEFDNLHDGEIAFKILIEPTDPSPDVVMTYTIEFKLPDHVREWRKFQRDHQPAYHIKEMIERMITFQEKYDKLYIQANEKFEEIKEQYKNKNFKVSLVEYRINDASNSETDTETKSVFSSSGYSSQSQNEPPVVLLEQEQPNQYVCSESVPSSNMVILGPNGTAVDVNDYIRSVQDKSAKEATKALARIVFKEKLLTDNLRRTKTYYRADLKNLSPAKMEDIDYHITSRYNVNSLFVRQMIAATSKYDRVKAKIISK